MVVFPPVSLVGGWSTVAFSSITVTEWAGTVKLPLASEPEPKRTVSLAAKPLSCVGPPRFSTTVMVCSSWVMLYANRLAMARRVLYAP